MTNHIDPRPPTRKELAEFLPNQRLIKAFEKLFDLIPTDLLNITDRLALLENPPGVEVVANYQATTDYYWIVATVPGLTITLPKASDDIKGRVWTVTLAAVGNVTVNLFAGDVIKTPDSATETSVYFDRRGSTVDFRCISATEWSFV